MGVVTGLDGHLSPPTSGDLDWSCPPFVSFFSDIVTQGSVDDWLGVSAYLLTTQIVIFFLNPLNTQYIYIIYIYIYTYIHIHVCLCMFPSHTTICSYGITMDYHCRSRSRSVLRAKARVSWSRHSWRSNSTPVVGILPGKGRRIFLNQSEGHGEIHFF